MICSRYGSRSCPARTASPVTLTQAALGDAAELADPGKRVLRGAPEGNAHQLKLSTKNRRQTLSAA